MTRRPPNRVVTVERLATLGSLLAATVAKSTRVELSWLGAAILFAVWAEGDRIVRDLWRDK